MLVIRRNEGQWVEVIHRGGDRMRFRTYAISANGIGRVHLAFDDPDVNFRILRPEAKQQVPPPGAKHAQDHEDA